MRQGDVDEVHHVASLCFPHPWDAETFRDELDRDWAEVLVLRPYGDDPVCAFVHFWIVADEVHVLNLATHPTCRRRGFGRLLMDAMIDRVIPLGALNVSLEVRVSNAPAIALYEGLGFAAIGTRPRYYADNDEDALVMLRKLDR